MDYTAFLTPTIGATGMLTLVVILILRGSLVPRRIIDDLRADKDQQIETWRSACTKLQETSDLKDQQISALLEASRTTTQVIAALPRAAANHERSGQHEVAQSPEA